MKFSTFVGFVVLVFIHPLSAFVTAAGYGYLWKLTLATQYGAGPSYQSWYGIATIAGLLLAFCKQIETKESKSPIASAFFKQIAFFMVIGTTILLVLLTRAMLGWN